MTYSAAAFSSCRHFYSVDHCNLVFDLYIVSHMFLHLFELIYAGTHMHISENSLELVDISTKKCLQMNSIDLFSLFCGAEHLLTGPLCLHLRPALLGSYWHATLIDVSNACFDFSSVWKLCNVSNFFLFPKTSKSAINFLQFSHKVAAESTQSKVLVCWRRSLDIKSQELIFNSGKLPVQSVNKLIKWLTQAQMKFGEGLSGLPSQEQEVCNQQQIRKWTNTAMALFCL